MQKKIRFLIGIYIFCILLSPYPAQSLDLGDDISFSWFTDDEPQPKKQSPKKNTASKENQKTTPAENSKKVSAQDNTKKENTPQNKQTNSQKSFSLPSISSLTSAKKETSASAVYHGNLIKKVRKGLKFSPQEMQTWIAKTPNINACYEDGQTMLIYLVKQYKDIQSLMMLIENGADIQTHCTPRYEALLIAAKSNPSAAVTEVLLNNGANFADVDHEGNTALMIAAAHNPSAKVIGTLIDFGVKPNALNKYGYDALMLAAYENGRLPIIQILLDNDINVNLRDPKGHTPIMAAAIRGRDKVMKYLITRGADYQAKDRAGISVLDYYHKRHYLEMFNFNSAQYKSPSERLSQEFNFIAQNHVRYNNALKQSIYAANPQKAVADALKNLADVDIKDENGCTPLINAARHNTPIEVFQTLIKADANPNEKCLQGQNALMFIAMNAYDENKVSDQIAKAEYLVHNGLNINATDNYGNTALMYALNAFAHKKFIEDLLKLKANPNQANKTMDTSLWLAVKKQLSADVIGLLTEYGADANEVNINGETPLWHQLRLETDEQAIIALIKGGADVNVPDAEGSYPLWYAFHRNMSATVINAIINKQADVNLKNESGDTPLLYAVKNEYPASVIKLLIKKGANQDIPDANGYTIYDIIHSDRYYDETLKRKNQEDYMNNVE